MFPYKDENPTILTPVVTVGIIAANLAAWLFIQGAGSEEAVLRSVCQLGLIPGEVLGRVPLGTAIPLGRDALGRLLACPNPIGPPHVATVLDRKSTRLNSSHSQISYAVFCLKKKKKKK